MFPIIVRRPGLILSSSLVMRAPSAGIFKVWVLGFGGGLQEERSLIFAILALFNVPESDLLYGEGRRMDGHLRLIVCML
jgi:hypothetical protein